MIYFFICLFIYFILNASIIFKKLLIGNFCQLLLELGFSIEYCTDSNN